MAVTESDPRRATAPTGVSPAGRPRPAAAATLAVDEGALQRMGTLVKLLYAGAGAVIVLTLVTAIVIATSQTALPGLDEVQRQSRGPIAMAVLAAGIAGAGVLAGLAGIMRLLIGERSERLGRP